MSIASFFFEPIEKHIYRSQLLVFPFSQEPIEKHIYICWSLGSQAYFCWCQVEILKEKKDVSLSVGSLELLHLAVAAYNELRKQSSGEIPIYHQSRGGGRVGSYIYIYECRQPTPVFDGWPIAKRLERGWEKKRRSEVARGWEKKEDKS